MLTIDNKQADLFETWIPEQLLQLPEELAFADKALGDSRVLEPFLKDCKTIGRPTTAISTYLRMMYLKFRYQMSYEVAVKEISDSYKWRRFCRLPMTGAVPDDKTLIKLTGRFGEAPVRAIHDAVVRQAVEAKIIRGRKMRLDTTVNESNIHYPTDTGLMSDGVRVITRTVRKIKEVVRLKIRFRNRTRSIKWRVLKIIKFLKGKKAEARKKREQVKTEILTIAQAAWNQAMEVLAELRRGKAEIKPGASSVRLATLPLELKQWLELMKRILEQTRTVLGGDTHIPNRLVSLFDPGARPIQKGKLFPKTEFGRKVLIQEAEKGIVTDFQTHQGNPRDDSLLDSAVDKHEEIFGCVPKEVAADRGFHSSDGDDRLHERGIKHVSIPVKGNKTDMRRRTERSSWFRRLQRWRAGGEAKISLLKRKFGLRKSLVRGDSATAIWLGWGIIAHNLTWMSRAGP